MPRKYLQETFEDFLGLFFSVSQYFSFISLHDQNTGSLAVESNYNLKKYPFSITALVRIYTSSKKVYK